MADDYTLRLQLSADRGNLQAALAASTRDLRNFERTIDSSMKNASKSSQSLATSLLKVEQADLAVEKATIRLASAQEKFGKNSLEARNAANQLAQAQLRLGETAKNTAASGSKIASGLAPANVAMRLGQGLAFGLGYSLVSALSSAAKESIQFQTNMRNVTSLLTSSGLSAQQLEAQYRGLSTGVLEISTRLPQSITQLSSGLYEVVSSGIPASQALGVLESSAKAASAGLSDTATSTNAIVGVMNAYGPAAGNATQVSDVLFQTVNAGVISFSQLAQNIGDVVGTAAAAKVPIQDVGAAIAAMTRAGIVPAEATTSLNRLITEIIQPSENLTRVYKTLGIESGSAALQQFGLYGVMQKVQAATGGSAESTLNLFNDIRAARGAFALMSNAGQTYAQTQQAIGDANTRTGATERALGEQRKSLAYQWKLLVNQFQVGAVAFEQDVEPALRVVIGGAAELAKFLGQNIHIVEALGVVVGVRLVQRFGLATAASNLYTGSLQRMTAATVSSMAASQAGATQATLAVAGLRAASSSALALIGGPVSAAALLAVTGISVSYQHAKSTADDFAASVSKRYDLTSATGLQDAIRATETELRRAQRDLDSFSTKAKFTVSSVFSGVAGNAGLDFFGKGPKTAEEKVKSLKRSLEELKAQQGDIAPSATTAASGISALQGSAESATAAVKAFEDAQKSLQQEFEQWATPSTAFQSALSDAQKALEAANAAQKKAASAGVKTQKDALNEQYKLDKAALQSQKDNISNRGRGSSDAINKEIADLGRKHQAQIKDLDAQGKYASGVTASNKSIAEQASVSVDAYIRKLKEQDDALQRFQQNLVTIAGKYGQGVATQLSKLGPEAAGLIDDFARLTGPRADAARKEIERNLDLTSNAADIETAMNLSAVAAAKGADAIGSGAVEALKGHTADLVRVASQYQIDLTKVADPILDALGLKKVNLNTFMGPTVQRTGTVVVPKADGGFDRGDPAIAPAGEMILWAEPETHGESYIPHNPAKRSRSVSILAQTADLFGLQVLDPRNGGSNVRRFANGGITSNLPFPPRLPKYPVAQQAQAVMDAMFAATNARIPQGNLEPGAGNVGQGWQAITAYLSGQHVPFTVTSTTGGGHAKNSLHYIGKAVDLVSSNMMQIYDTLFSVGKGLKELIYSPAGVGIKNGQPVDIKSFYGDAVYKQHFNHVHAGTYDSGGWIQPGASMVVNKSGKPEAVLTNAQWERLFTALEGGANRPQITIHGDARSTTEIARKVVRKVKR